MASNYPAVQSQEDQFVVGGKEAELEIDRNNPTWTTTSTIAIIVALQENHLRLR